MTNSFKVGDVVELDPSVGINGEIPKRWGLHHGERYAVAQVDRSQLTPEDPQIFVFLEGIEFGWYPQRFRLVEEPIQLDGPPKVPVHLEDVIVEPERRIVNRAYDFNAGDERKFDRAEAIELGRLRAIERGVRQQVRISGPAVIDGPPLWLIQDVL